MLNMQLVGADLLQKRFQRYMAFINKHLPRQLKLEAEYVIFEAQKIVPYDEGDLHDSGWSGQPYRSGGGWDINLGFSMHYAARQHYDLTLQHTHGEALYLEKAMKRSRKRVAKNMARLTRLARAEYLRGRK